MRKPSCSLYKIKIYRNDVLEQFDTKDDILLSDKCIFLDHAFTPDEIKRFLTGLADSTIKDMEVKNERA